MSADAQSQAAGAEAEIPRGLDRLLEWYRTEAFRQAVRVSLAMTLVYSISLSMGWERPDWAGLAVAMCSLGTVGDSFNKGMLRIFGTAVAGCAALVLLALFPQDRWHYLLCMTVYLSFCTYMMGQTSRWYFWSIAGYVMPLLALSGGPESGNTFEVIVLRLQQTGLGVVVFTLVSVMLWPQNAAPALANTVSQLAGVQRRLLAAYLGRLSGLGDRADTAGLRAQATGAAARLSAAVDGAELDSFEVWETRKLWRHVAGDLARLNSALEQWQQGFRELQHLELPRLLPGLPAATAELVARLAEIEAMLAGKAPARLPADIELTLDPQAVAGLSQFDRAAVLLTRDQLRDIDRLTRSLFLTIADICDFGPRSDASLTSAPEPLPPALDPDLLIYAVRTFTAVWIILLACIYVPDLPMPAGVIPTGVAIVIQLALMPTQSTLPVILPVLAALAYAGAFHVLLMPQLSSFASLGPAIFIGVFIFMIAFGKPQHGVLRVAFGAMFVMVISVKNEQTYNFLIILNLGVMFVLALVAGWISGWFPFYLAPAQRVSRQLRRLLTSGAELLAMEVAAPGWPLRAMRRDFHLREVATLPDKIGRWLQASPVNALDEKFPGQAGTFVGNLQLLSNHLRNLFSLRSDAHTLVLARQLEPEFESWRSALVEVLQGLSREPSSADGSALRSRLDSKLAAMEERIAQVLNAAPPDSDSSRDESEELYRLLGAYRGLSQAIIDVVESGAQIDWDALRESRF
jgi:uncharacterized membrane protein YccC